MIWFGGNLLQTEIDNEYRFWYQERDSVMKNIKKCEMALRVGSEERLGVLRKLVREIWTLKTLLVKAQKEMRKTLLETGGRGSLSRGGRKLSDSAVCGCVVSRTCA